MDRSCHRLTLSALVISTDKGPIVYKTTEYKESNEVYKERSSRRSVRRQILALTRCRDRASNKLTPRDRLQSEIAPTLTSEYDQERTPNNNAENQEWPIHGVFKQAIVSNKVRYSMEFSLGESHGLMCQ
jgi:hypothetical protein